MSDVLIERDKTKTRRIAELEVRAEKAEAEKEKARQERDEAEAEVERLREALEWYEPRITRLTGETPQDEEDRHTDLEEMCKDNGGRARAALEPKP